MIQITAQMRVLVAIEPVDALELPRDAGAIGGVGSGVVE
jgi:hypothetical protein